MTLDVETPEPPTLRGPPSAEDYDAVDESEDGVDSDAAREALAAFLQDGAWEDAFDDWSDRTYLSEETFRIAVDSGLIDEFDFYWNQSAADVGYRAPSPPERLAAPDGEPLERSEVRDLEEELDDLGRTVSEVLENDYIHRSGDEFGFFADR